MEPVVILENVPVGHQVATILASDPDSNSDLRFVLVDQLAKNLESKMVGRRSNFQDQPELALECVKQHIYVTKGNCSKILKK